MDWVVKAFLKASLAWLAAGVSLGLAMAIHPRFTGHQLHSRPMFATLARVLLGLGGGLSATAAYQFVYDMWRTIDGPKKSAALASS